MKKFSIFILVLIIIFLDQAAKFVFKGKNILITNFFSINYVKNYGAAFGILQGKNILFILISIFVILLILYYLRKASSKLQISLSFILAGTIGNLIDRIFLGYVIDFIDFKVWPVFNVADTFNTIGALLLVYILFRYKT